MYDTHIQTTITIRGFLVFIEYRVTPEWAVEWWLNEGAYSASEQWIEVQAALDLLDHLLRTHEDAHITRALLDEFESRQYEEEQRLSAMTAEEDIPF